MSTLSLLHQDGRWLAFDGDRVTRLDARPRLDRAAVVVTDFDGAVSQVTALEGSPSHAVALIEKRLRADGLIDNESKILIHRTRTVGNGYQALFTAVPLDRWQQLFAWAEGQPDHCLLVPTAALLWQLLKPGRGVVLHSGRQFVFLAALRNRMVYASALAFSDSQSDLAMTVASLAERAGRELAGADDALEPLTVEWCGALTPAPQAGAPAEPAEPAVAPWPPHDLDEVPTQRTTSADAQVGGMTFDGQFDESAPTAPPPPVALADNVRSLRRVAPAAAPTGPARWSDEVLLEIFATHSGASVRLGPHTQVTDADGVRYRTSIGQLAAGASAWIAVNPPASRLMYFAERLLPWASAASLVLALALGGLGGRWALAAHAANERADGLASEIEAVQAQIAGLAPRQALPEAYPQLAGFIERASGLQRALDPHATLLTVREAAGDDVRILRVRLDRGDDGDSLRVDGMVNHADSALQGRQVARFVERLRTAGYEPVAVDPQAGNARSQSPGGSFSYLLKPQARTAPAAGGAS